MVPWFIQNLLWFRINHPYVIKKCNGLLKNLFCCNNSKIKFDFFRTSLPNGRKVKPKNIKMNNLLHLRARLALIRRSTYLGRCLTSTSLHIGCSAKVSQNSQASKATFSSWSWVLCSMYCKQRSLNINQFQSHNKKKI